MNLEKLKQLLAVPTHYYKEDRMVAYLKKALAPVATRVWVDQYRNVYAIKSAGTAPFPCLSAHIDSVQPLRRVTVVEDNGYLRGLYRGKPAGLGADDKTGVHVCLELFNRLNHVALALFAGEEVGLYGSYRAASEFFQQVGYLIEFDCPSRNMVSYTSDGVRLFANQGDFIYRAAPVLKRFGSLLWQQHPYTDVKAIRLRFPLSCLNLSSGYYNWHQQNEFVKVSDVALAVEQGAALVKALGCVRYYFPVGQLDEDTPLVPIGPLRVPAP